MSGGRRLDELRTLLVGQTYLSGWLQIDQPQIDRFAEATMDFQFIHTDAVRAVQTAFGGTIAHGLLLLSLLPHLHATADRPKAAGIAMVVNYGFDRIRFVSPVRAGSAVRARFTIEELIERHPNEFLQTLDVVLEVEDRERPAMVARWLTQINLTP